MCAALLAGTAQARTVVTTPGPYQRWVDGAKVATPDGEYRVYGREGCPDPAYAGDACTTPATREIYGVAGDRGVFLHELGHNFAYWHLDWPERHRIAHIIGRRWSGERFADLYAVCGQKRNWRSNARLFVWDGWIPEMRGKRMRRICAEIDRSY